MEPLREIRNRLLNGWQLSKLHTFEVAARHQSPHVASPFLSGSTENRCGLPVFPMVVSDVNCQELRDR